MSNLISIGKFSREMHDYKSMNEPNFIIPHNYDRKLKLIEIQSLKLSQDQITRTSNYVSDLRKAAEVHKIVRRNIQEYIKPNIIIPNYKWSC